MKSSFCCAAVAGAEKTAASAAAVRILRIGNLLVSKPADGNIE
jgi:hypothetical protein